MKRFRLLPRFSRWLALLVVCGGCAQRMPAVVLPATALPLPTPAVPAGDYHHLAWPDQGLVVQAYLPSSTKIWIYWVNPDGTLGDPLPLPRDPAFASTQYKLPSRLPDGRLSMIGYRHTTSPAGALQDRTTLEVYDPATGQTSRLIEQDLPRDSIGLVAGFAWSPDLRRAFVSNSSSDLFWWTAEARFVPFSEQVTSNDLIDWSPDGTTLVYQDFDDPYDPSALYLLDADGGNKRLLVDGILAMTDLAWSPNGRWIAFTGTFDRSRTNHEQIWLINPQTGERVELVAPKGFYRSLAWSPDSDQIALIWQKPAVLPPDSYILTLDLPGGLWK